MIQRKYLAHYINTSPTSQTANYERLGRDLEEYSPELSPQVDTHKNILGQTSVNISGYEKTGAVTPYYADENSALFQMLQDIIDGNKTMEDLKTDVVEVKLWESPDTSGAYPAIRETVYLEVNGYGGDATGYQIPFTVHYNGEKTAGTFKPTTGAFDPDD